MNEKRHIILFDGVCNLCNRSVQSIIKKDKKGVIKFASLQSDTGQNLLMEFELPKGDFQSFVYIKNNRCFTRSDAALEVAKTLQGIWEVAYIFKIIPKFIRDGVYNIIAQNRYKWFGEKDACMIPTPELRERFL